MSYKIAVQCMTFGEAVPAPALEPVRLELATERISVRELLARTVTEQIRGMSEQRLVEANSVRQALARHYLTSSEVEQQAMTGRVRLAGGNHQRETAEIDVAAEISKVLRGFEAKVFRVIVDGTMLDSLDEDIILTRDSKVIFLRLMPLVGG